MKFSKLSVLWRNSHAHQVLVIPNGLEVATAEEKVNFVAVAAFEVGDLFVDCAELAVAAALDCDLVRRAKFRDWMRGLMISNVKGNRLSWYGQLPRVTSF